MNKLETLNENLCKIDCRYGIGVNRCRKGTAKVVRKECLEYNLGKMRKEGWG